METIEDKQGNKYIGTLRKRREKVHGNTIEQTRKNYIETLRQRMKRVQTLREKRKKYMEKLRQTKKSV